ncbi:caspase family protein [Planktothricoides raciborskii]|uniref:Caspase family protein n=2 Tax=Planktothricoides raciborskii TaxID=132608 RepID=A0AAU8J9N8_9CYAN|nr:caspase family protein [Planktothricoides raciborskii]MBD2543003.1 caspase family protein [Planktothricoides raciborskii FACHB-1370]MBD2581882.1 caspase family protein [Planktothricoides raciborskii FACHB-1261]
MTAIFQQGFALVVGVGGDLPNTIDDAKGLANILKDEGRCAYPTNQVNLLVSEAAIRENILSGLDNLAQTSNPDATVVIYFSGHGYHVETSIGSQYYLMPFWCQD